MHIVNYLRVVGCEHDVAKKAERVRKAIGKTTEAAREAYKCKPI